MNQTSYLIAAFAGVVLTAVAQLLMKLGARHTHHRHAIFVYLSPYSIAAYGLLVTVTLLNLYAFKVLPIKLGVELLPITYILIGVFSFTILKERMTRNQLIGSAIVICGIVIFNL